MAQMFSFHSLKIQKKRKNEALLKKLSKPDLEIPAPILAGLRVTMTVKYLEIRRFYSYLFRTI